MLRQSSRMNTMAKSFKKEVIVSVRYGGLVVSELVFYSDDRVWILPFNMYNCLKKTKRGREWSIKKEITTFLAYFVYFLGGIQRTNPPIGKKP